MWWWSPPPRRSAATARSSAPGMGTIPMLGARLARATFEPDLLVSDGEAFFIANDLPIGGNDKSDRGVDPVPLGLRHAVGRSTPRDDGRHRRWTATATATSPTSVPGSSRRRSCSACAAARATRSTTPRASSSRSTRRRCSSSRSTWSAGSATTAPPRVGEWTLEDHDLRRVITNLAVLDFATPDHRMRLVSTHPGVTVADVQEATGFELVVDGDVPETRGPTDEEREVIDRLDPRGLRHREVQPACTRGCTRSLCDLVGVAVPDRADRHGLGRRARGSSPPPPNAGGLGILASATMDIAQLRSAVAEVKARTTEAVRRQPARRRRRHRRAHRADDRRGRPGGVASRRRRRRR